MAFRAAKHPNFTLTALVCSLSLVFILVAGCSETQPTTTEFSTTTLNLTPRSFPSPPAGMIYELWLLRNNPPFQSPLPSSVDAKSLGRFGWDQNIYIMRDENNIKRERVFELDFSILEWQYIAISIENIDSLSNRPKSIFLWDRIQDPDVKQFLSLKFPLGYDTTVTGFVSMESPTDGNLFADEAGVWFSVYSVAGFRLQDTTDIQSIPTSPQFPRDSAKDDSLGTTLDTLGIDSVVPLSYLRFGNFNLDTFTVKAVRAFLHTEPINMNPPSFDTVFGTKPDTIIDTSLQPPDTVIGTRPDTIVDTIPGKPETLTFGDAAHLQTVIYEADRDYVFLTSPTVVSPSGDTTLFDVAAVSNFSNGFIDLHDLTGTGWHYKGWIVGPHVSAQPTNFVRMNFGENKVINWEKEGRLLYGTGIWLDTLIDSVLDTVLVTNYGPVDPNDPNSPDSIISRKVFRYSNEIGYNFPGDNGGYNNNRPPPFPGEDFLVNLPLLPPITSGGPAWNFLGTAADTAIVIVTIEPDNYYDSTRNFPLIVLGRELAPRPINNSESLNQRFNNIKLMNFSGITEPFPNARQSWPLMLVEHTLR